jgi:hypothetical protein
MIHMQDQEFEKKVQQKMEELKFSPSPAVWTNVQRKIGQKEKGKRLIAILFFFGFLGLVGSGIYFYDAQRKPMAKAIQPPNLEASPDSSTKYPGSKPPVALPEANVEPKKAAGPPLSFDSLGVSRFLQNNQTTQVSRHNFQAKKEDGTSLAAAGANKPAHSAPVSGDSQAVREDKTRGNIGSAMAPGLEAVGHSPGAGSQKENQDNQALKSINKIDTTGKSTSTNPAIAKLTKQKNWKFGFNAGTGFSTVSQKSPTNPAGVFYLGYSPAFPLYGFGAARIQVPPSKPQANFSFWAGLLVEKPISSKISLSMGLNYHYYSTTIRTGPITNDSTFVFTSFNTTMGVHNYYNQGSSQTFVNKYHFLELPIALEYRFGVIKSFPLSLEGGLSLSQWIGSTALMYDYVQSYYYKNNSAFAKTQVNSTLGIMGELKGNHLEFRMGPEFQYGLTNLLNGKNGEKQHLLFAGIKFVVLPWQK